jgi:hypothetical protein
MSRNTQCYYCVLFEGDFIWGDGKKTRPTNKWRGLGLLRHLRQGQRRDSGEMNHVRYILW